MNNLKKEEEMAKRIWSAYQQAVFQDIAEGRGHTVVRARAGCAKTTTIVEGFNHIPRGKTAAMFAFNKSIAEELSARAPGGVEVSTLHSYGNKACRRTYPKARIDKERVMKLATAIYGDEHETYDKRRNLCKLVSLAKGSLADEVEELEYIIAKHEIDMPSTEDSRLKFISDALSILEQCRTNVNSIDFDDMIWLPVVNDLYTWKYDRVFIDETQDLNPAQIERALRAVKPGGRIMAVGDDRQAIYGFRGADSNAVDNVVERLKAKVMPLSISYRCAKSIVIAAKEIVHDFEYAENAPEGSVTSASKKDMMQQASAGDFILSRTNAPLIGLCLSFIREGQRANIQGRDVGQSLKGLVKSAKKECDTVLEFATWLREWFEKMVEQAQAHRRDTQVVEDKYECMIALSEGSRSFSEIEAKIDSLFSDEANEGKIVLSTTHKAKGLERDRVFVLANTYRNRPGIEELNLWYVAMTRARETLVMVTDPSWAPKKRREVES